MARPRAGLLRSIPRRDGRVGWTEGGLSVLQSYQSYSLERGKSQAPRKPEEHDEITIAGLRSTFKNASFPQRDSGQAPRALDPDRLPTRSMLPHRGGDARRRRIGSCLLAAAIASCAGVQQPAASSTPP